MNSEFLKLDLQSILQPDKRIGKKEIKKELEIDKKTLEKRKAFFNGFLGQKTK